MQIATSEAKRIRWFKPDVFHRHAVRSNKAGQSPVAAQGPGPTPHPHLAASAPPWAFGRTPERSRSITIENKMRQPRTVRKGN